MAHLLLSSKANMAEELRVKLKVYGVLFTIPVVLLLSIFSARNYYSARAELNQLESEVAELQATIDTFNSNRQLINNQIDNYNHVLQSIIPEKEDYFSIILALEKLSQQTGFVITQYTVELTKSNTEKLALTVEGDGDAEAFLKFLKQYQYEGGRLITNERMEYGNSNSGTTKLSLNFYHKSIPATGEQIKPISNADVNLINEIQSKVTVSFTEPIEDGIIDYETKSDPF